MPLPPTVLQFRDDALGVDLEEVGSFVSSSPAASRPSRSSGCRTGIRPTTPTDADGLARRSDGDRVAVAAEDDVLDDWEDRDDTLADDDQYRALAEALDDRDVYGASLNTLA